MRSVGHCAVVLFATFSLAIAALTCDRSKGPSQPSTPEQVEPAPLEKPGIPPESKATSTSDRTTLPIPAARRQTYTELSAREVEPPKPAAEIRPPRGAPNVVVVLIDDFGFGVASTFGGPIPTPTMDELAANGLRYNNFHTTALCSPTRVALKTGRNHHMANVGSIMETATAFPGNTGRIPNRIAGLPTILQLNGYSTAAFGKWHETPVWETSVSGPFSRWPLQQGFDHFYGFIGGETNQWAPALFDGQTRVEIPERPGYHFLTDMTDRAIEWLRAQHAMTPDKPFFVYYAPGATHAPHHVPKEWIAMFEGKFDAGWDVIREQTLERQKQLGIVPADTKLPPKPDAIPDWDDLSELEQRVFSRQAEVYAAYAAMTDFETGRLLDTVAKLGEADNTLVVFIAGDNGASAEGGMVGAFNELTYFNEVEEQVADIAEHLDEWGGPETYPHMAAGWAVALDSPHKWTKQVASDYGGTRNPLIIRWPRRVTKIGELREQFHHVIDVAPTVLEAAGLPQPAEVDGVEQIPMQGVSMLYSFADADADSRHTTQYFEMLGNRAIYHDGWLARTIHRAPWETQSRRPLAEDEWELYHVAEDFSLATELSEQYPEKLTELRALFMREAVANHVLPIDDRLIERANVALAGRPDLLAGRTSLTVYPGMVGMLENNFINIKNTSFVITARLADIGRARPKGTILAQGGRFGGWSLYVDGGKPAFTYNFLGLEQYTIASRESLPPGEVELRFEFDYDGGEGAGGEGKLFIGDKQVASGRIERTQPYVFSADETADVGVDLATGVVAAIGGEAQSRLVGAEIDSITISIAEPNSR